MLGNASRLLPTRRPAPRPPLTTPSQTRIMGAKIYTFEFCAALLRCSLSHHQSISEIRFVFPRSLQGRAALEVACLQTPYKQGCQHFWWLRDLSSSLARTDSGVPPIL
jgi:hypothetical protein